MILGGSRGLGKSIRSQLEQSGWSCTTISTTRPVGSDGAFISCDLSDPTSVEQAEHVLERMPSIDAFFWVAGEHLEGATSTLRGRDIRRLTAVNLTSGLILSAAAWRHFCLIQNRGHLIVVSSTSGSQARAGEAVYCATKFAQVGFARSIGLEAAEGKNKVTLVMPGGMKTEMWANRPERDTATYHDPEFVARAIITTIAQQSEPFYELKLPRTSCAPS